LKVKNYLKHVGLETPEQRAWALYDWGNSAFATTIMAAILPIYFHDVAAIDLAEHDRSAYWGYTSALSLFIVALLSPLLGAFADVGGYKKAFVGVFTFLGSIATLGLWWVDRGDYLLAAFLYLLGNIGFAGASVFYDALLPAVAPPRDLHRVSSAGYALGYLGGGILLAFNLLVINNYEIFHLADKKQAVKASFVSVSVWWILFMIPMMKRVPEPGRASGRQSLDFVLKASFQRLRETAGKIRNYPQVWLFLLSFWFYSDGIGTIIKMATTYGREVGISSNHLIGALLLVQFVGIPATFFFGKIADKLGPKASLQICIVVYGFICLIGYFMTEAIHFWALSILVALVQGGSQAISRSLYTQLVPQNQLSEFFAFMSVSSRFAGILGPFLFGVTSQLAGSSQLSLLLLVSFFIIGGGVLYFVDIEAGKKAALLEHN
jgi:UMF1 family MFS transporter